MQCYQREQRNKEDEGWTEYWVYRDRKCLGQDLIRCHQREEEEQGEKGCNSARSVNDQPRVKKKAHEVEVGWENCWQAVRNRDLRGKTTMFPHPPLKSSTLKKFPSTAPLSHHPFPHPPLTLTLTIFSLTLPSPASSFPSPAHFSRHYFPLTKSAHNE